MAPTPNREVPGEVHLPLRTNALFVATPNDWSDSRHPQQHHHPKSRLRRSGAAGDENRVEFR
jgi:hypothetical protein